MSASYRTGIPEGIMMPDMTSAPAHAKPKDHLWVLGVIAACCLIKVWPSWVAIGAEARFPEIVRMPTDWTLAVVVEAYWAYAVYAWLAVSAGRRSGRFAMWSAAAVFVLSLTAQSSAALMNAKAAGAFANAMPVTVLALVAVLVHLRHLDRADALAAGEAQQEAGHRAARASAEAERLAELEAALAAERAEREAAQLAASEAERREAEAERKAEQAARKLAAQKPSGTRPKVPNAGGRTAPNAASRTRIPDDVDARTEALGIYLANPKITGRELGEAVGLGERWGQKRKAEFAAAAPADPQARSGQ